MRGSHVGFFTDSGNKCGLLKVLSSRPFVFGLPKINDNAGLVPLEQDDAFSLENWGAKINVIEDTDNWVSRNLRHAATFQCIYL